MKKSQILRMAGETVAVIGVVATLYLSTATLSCKMTAAGFQMLQGDFRAPELREFLVTGTKTATLRFSEAVDIEDVRVSAGEITGGSEGGSAGIAVTREDADGEKSVMMLSFAEETVIGGKYRLSGVVVDRAGNTLDFSVSFTGYNGRVPKLSLSEVRSKYTNPKSGKKKVEFIELYAASAGNLAGVILYNAADGLDKAYEFPVIEVKAGEYIVVHYRKTGDECIDETGTKLRLSGGQDASDSRDLWVPTNTARIAETDVILLRERAGGELLDALLYAESKVSEWKNAALKSAAEEAFEAGLWPDGSEPVAALCSDGVTATRTIGRQNMNKQGKAAWLVTATSSASPGVANSRKAYTN